MFNFFFLYLFWNSQKHPFHLVDSSPWPILGSFSALVTATGFVIYLHGYTKGAGSSAVIFGLSTLIIIMLFWWEDIISEATFEGQHTKKVQEGLRMGMMLFIVSEVMFFFAFFWAFFNSAFTPNIEIGSVWPPQSIKVISPWEVPFLNTVILLTSGVTVTWCHYAILAENRIESIMSLLITIGLAIVFTGCQVFEYYTASFNISDGIYGSTFYLTTGFHGFHVFIGTIFLIICLIRIMFWHFSNKFHFGFEAAAWYWHFVDIVWLFLFVYVYCWGGN